MHLTHIYVVKKILFLDVILGVHSIVIYVCPIVYSNSSDLHNRCLFIKLVNVYKSGQEVTFLEIKLSQDVTVYSFTL